MIDLNQVSLALRNCTARSLILLDEFGKGTAAAGSYYISESNTKTCLLKSTPCSSLLLIPFVLNRRCCPLCWSLEASTRPRRQLLKGNSHDALSRAILHWRTRSSESCRITFIHMEIMFATPTGEIIDDASTTTITKGENITYPLQVADHAIC